MIYNQSENKKVKQIRLESFKAHGIHLYYKNEYVKYFTYGIFSI